jgi:hypothetical protein
MASHAPTATMRPVRQALEPHPETPCPFVQRLEALAEREGDRLNLSYRLAGDLATLAIPAPAAAVRTDGLWAHTCFEAFAAAGGEGYLEFNLSPSGAWAAYRFDGYRQGMAPLEGIEAPRIEVARAGEALELRAVVRLPWDAPLRVGLATVIEVADGRLSYWALRHPAAVPDFHNAAAFVLAL